MKKFVRKPFMTAVAFVIASLFSGKNAVAQITQPNAWTQQYAAQAYPPGAINASYAIPNGTNRILLVAVATTRTNNGAITCSATYGGQPLTPASGDGATTTQWNHTFLFYLLDAQIGSAAAGKSLNVTCSNTGTSAPYFTSVFAAVYAGVNQTTPLTDSKNFNTNGNNSTNVGPINLNTNANDQAISVINLARSATGGTLRTITNFATNWSSSGLEPSFTASGSNNTVEFQAYIGLRTVPVTNVTGEAATHTASSTNTFSSYSALSLKVVLGPVVTSLSAGSGCVGSSLTINGTNLSGATSVTIGGTAATITNNTATSITVTVGSGTTGIVSVTTAAGTGNSASSFTVNPIPSISGTLSVCAGATTQLTGSGTPDAIAPWTSATTSVATIDNSGLVTGVSNGTSLITYKTSQGCTNTATVTVNALPTASAAKVDVKCNGTTTGQITVSGSGGSGTYTFYSITNGLPLPVPNGYQANPVFSNLGAGQYFPRVIDSNGCISKSVQ